MKTKRWLLSVTLALIFLSNFSHAETVTIRADNWFPINGNPESATPGYMIELATRIFGDAGHTVDYQTLPWKRAIVFVRKGLHDCVVGGNRKDTPDFVFPNVSWGVDSAVFYVKKDEKWRYTDLQSITSIQLGLIGGYAYNDEFTAFIKKNKAHYQLLTAENSLENNIKKLMAERITATLESPLVMQAKLKEMELVDQIIPAGQLGESFDIYIACSPAKASSKALVKLIDEGTQKLRQSGELQTILDKYGVKDWIQ
ncbi:substrate-binding periplasmic protein [Alkalimarinus alittae]|uniref:Transporter substrate-binding domain-containing protein n=1 Tax=Alkalimarinus alittae TaxID=2961619 RepID=A0ABY6N051_9ALTE|nr:transporter substrate-binding domain-containing protein [Alkalimarinus alittae]UZE95374.1 transporter substrate-binding domain-containing protein [Alkalimarinus alittae]